MARKRDQQCRRRWAISYCNGKVDSMIETEGSRVIRDFIRYERQRGCTVKVARKGSFEHLKLKRGSGA